MQNQSTEKSHRLRIIILSIIAVVIVVLIGVWLIVAAMRSVHRGQAAADQPSSAPTISTSSDQPAVAEPSSTSVSSPADQYKNDSATSSSSAPAAPSAPAPSRSSDIPSTGPEDVLFSAALIGVAVFLLGKNLQLAKARSTVL